MKAAGRRKPAAQGTRRDADRAALYQGRASPDAPIAFRTPTSEIRNPDGSVVFRLDDIEVPEAWSQVACDVLAQKYFRKAGVPARLKESRRTTFLRSSGWKPWASAPIRTGMRVSTPT